MYTSYSSCGQRAEKFGALTDMGMVRMPVNAFGFFFADDLQEMYGAYIAKIVFFWPFWAYKGTWGGAHISTSAPKKVYFTSSKTAAGAQKKNARTCFHRTRVRLPLTTMSLNVTVILTTEM